LVSETVRIIEYQILSLADFAELGFLAEQPKPEVCWSAQVGVLRCVNRRGEKVTLVGDGSYTRRLLETGAAADPAGVRLPASKFPIKKDGWPGRLEITRTHPAGAARESAAEPAPNEGNHFRQSA